MVKIENLNIKYKEGFELRPVNQSIEKGEIVSVVGETGSGKSTFGNGIVRLNGKDVSVSGNVEINGINIYNCSEKELKDYRSSVFSIAFQNARDIFNPLLKIREQIFENFKGKLDEKEINTRIKEFFEALNLEDRVLDMYPSELSGGMIQRVLLISALITRPPFVVLDEPTSALDKDSKALVIKLIKNLNEKYGMTFLVITHDIGLVEEISDRIMVFYGGLLVEVGNSDKILEKPKHPYTRGLLNACVDLNPYKDIWGIRPPTSCFCKKGCPFAGRCNQKIKECEEVFPELKYEDNRGIACIRGGILNLLKSKNVSKSFGKYRVLKNVDIEVYFGEIVSLVGSSGVGKTTFSKIIGGYLEKEDGEIIFEGRPVNYKEEHKKLNGIQMVFQDPVTSINQRFSVEEAVSEPLILANLDQNVKEEVLNVLKEVGLPCNEEFFSKKIKSLSGGQKQKISIARALIMKPKLLIADEPTSMLDTSSKANLLRFLKGLQNKIGFTLFMVTHDIKSAVKISDRIYILNKEDIKEYNNLTIKTLFTQ